MKKNNINHLQMLFFYYIYIRKKSELKMRKVRLT